MKVCLHVTEMKFYPMMKKTLFTIVFLREMKRVQFHPETRFSLKEKLLFGI